MLRSNVTVDDVRRARKLVCDDITCTPLLRAPDSITQGIAPSSSNPQVYFKCENFQRTKSFKARGAFSVLRSMSREELAGGVITRSSGNFAQALSLAAKELGVSATIVMPENAPLIKVQGTRKYGAKIVSHGITTQESMSKVYEIAEQTGKTVLSPFDHPEVIAGQGTAALELLEQLPEIENFFCPVGGGGLMAGCGLVLKNLKPSVRIIAVEPQGADDFYLSRQNGSKITLENTDTIADGLRTASVGELNWILLQRYVDDVLLVSDEEIRDSMRVLRDEMGMVVEPSGAVSLAGWKKCSGAMASGASVCLLSGANVDYEVYRSLTE